MIENCFCRHLQCVKIQKSRRCQHMHCDNEAHFASFHDPPSTEITSNPFSADYSKYFNQNSGEPFTRTFEQKLKSNTINQSIFHETHE